MSADKKQKSKSGKDRNTNAELKVNPVARIISKNLLKICYVIAIFDLVHALYFAVQVIILLVKNASVYAILALVGTIFWAVIVIVLVVGLWKRRPSFVRAWLIFSVVGFVVDFIFLLWGIATSIIVDWDRIQEFTILFAGIIIELTCIFLIYKHYLLMDSFRPIDEPEKGKKKNKRESDSKAYQDKKNTKSNSKKSSKQSDKKKKTTK